MERNATGGSASVPNHEVDALMTDANSAAMGTGAPSAAPQGHALQGLALQGLARSSPVSAKPPISTLTNSPYKRKLSKEMSAKIMALHSVAKASGPRVSPPNGLTTGTTHEDPKNDPTEKTPNQDMQDASSPLLEVSEALKIVHCAFQPDRPLSVPTAQSHNPATLKRKHSQLGSIAGHLIPLPNLGNGLAAEEGRQTPKLPPRRKKARVGGAPRCVKCGRMSSAARNAFVTCPGCGDTWHQHCHDPTILDRQVGPEPGPGGSPDPEFWECAECVKHRADWLKRQDADAERFGARRREDIERRRAINIGKMPANATIEKPHLVGFSSAGGSRWEVCGRRRSETG